MDVTAHELYEQDLERESTQRRRRAEAKAQLSSLLDRVHHGETVTIAKNNLPIADLVKHQPRGKRRLGLLRGQIVVPDDFTDEDPAINDLFYPSGE